MENISLFVFLIFILLPNQLNSEIVLKFKKQNELNKYENLFKVNIQFFGDYFINNKYITDIYIGEPFQKIPGYLNPTQSGFYLTEKSCPLKAVYNYENSKSFKLIDKKTYSTFTILRFSDSLHFEYNNNKYDYEFFSDKDLNNSICVNIGTKILGYGELVEDNLINRLHNNKIIKSYYFTFEYDQKNKDNLTYIFDLDIKNNEKGYTFIKTSSYLKDNRQNLVWGLDFDSLKLNNSIAYEKYFRAEFNVNLDCITASSTFKEEFDLMLKENNINEISHSYYKRYEIYIFNKKSHFDKLKDFTINFYHKSLDYNFILDYHDLFYENNENLYFLILFNINKQEYWEFGEPFLKKYKFIYNQDNKFIGFIKDTKETQKIISNNDNINDEKTNNKAKIIVIVVLILIFIIIATLFFGFLIGKKIYKVRKNKTNELLELYDYNSKNDNGK